MMSAIDCLVGETPISGLAAISRYRERKLVSQFWQHIGLNDRDQLLRFCHGDIQSLPSSYAAVVYCAPHAEVGLQRVLQAAKIVRAIALRFEEDRTLSPVASPIVHEPNRERLRMRKQPSYRPQGQLSFHPNKTTAAVQPGMNVTLLRTARMDTRHCRDDEWEKALAPGVPSASTRHTT